jgi:uncharacterized protein YdeI (YjbR/CyaY-like superfamily)
MNTESVDAYIEDGCGRCDLYRTADCKVLLWTDALVALRQMLLETELEEEMKWGVPCYTLDGKNVLMMTSFRRGCALSFFKGAAFDDPEGLLTKPGPNSRYARLLEFTSLEQVESLREQTEAFIQVAIQAERDGVEVVVEDDEPMPEELERRLATDAGLADAFEKLTPGRQRSHILHISGAKQSATRERRVEKCAPKIIAGKGFNER